MSRIGNLFYRLFIDDKGLVAEASKAGKKAGDAAGDAAGKGMNTGLKKSLSGGGVKQGLLQGLGLGAGLGAVSAITAGVGAVTDAIAGMIDAASDQREAMSLSTQVFEGNADEMQAWADTADTAFGQSKREALDFAAKFGNAFKNVGFTLDETADKSKEMTRLAADLASAFNSTSEEASTALRSGLLGESEPLRRFGVFLSEAAVQAKAAQMGVAKLGDKLTDGQKVAARYAIIMEQTADSQGMFGRDTESLADAQKIAQAQMENLAAELGNELLPIMVDVTGATVSLVTGIRDLAQGVDDALEPLGGLGGLLEAVSTAYGGPGAAAFRMAKDAEKAAKETVRDIEALRGAAGDDLGAVELSLDGAGDAAGGMATDIDKASEKSAESIEDMRDRTIAAVNDLIGRALDPLIEKDELAADRAELNAQRRALAAAKAGSDEAKAAAAAIRVLEKSVLDHQVALFKVGALNKTELSQLTIDLKSEIGKATGAAKSYLQSVLNKILELERVGKVVPINIRYSSTGQPLADHRAAGGSVTAGLPYVVGERRPELFVPNVSGHVYPSVQAGRSVAAGGDTYQIGVTMPVQVAPDPFEVGNQLRRLADYKRLTVPKR